MHLSLALSRSNASENNDFKNHYRIKIYRKSAHTWIWMFLGQFIVVKNIPRKTGESLLMLLPTCASRAWHMCTSRVVFVHPRSFAWWLFLCLGSEIVEILRVKARVFSLDWKGELQDIETLTPKGVLIGFLLVLTDLSLWWAWVT